MVFGYSMMCFVDSCIEVVRLYVTGLYMFVKYIYVVIFGDLLCLFFVPGLCFCMFSMFISSTCFFTYAFHCTYYTIHTMHFLYLGLCTFFIELLG